MSSWAVFFICITAVTCSAILGYALYSSRKAAIKEMIDNELGEQLAKFKKDIDGLASQVWELKAQIDPSKNHLATEILRMFSHLFDEPIFKIHYYQPEEVVIEFQEEIDQIRKGIQKNFNVNDEKFIDSIVERINRKQIGKR